MASARNTAPPTETMPKQGVVSEVVQEWLVKEDGALAERLQSQEIDEHYCSNRHRSEQLRADADWARSQKQMFAQLVADAATARQLASDEEAALLRRRQLQEEADEQLAQKLMASERRQRRQLRETRQVDEEARLLGLETRLMADMCVSRPNSSTVSASVNIANSTSPTLHADAGGNAAGAGGGGFSDDDLSDLMAPPPSHQPLSEDEYRLWQEQQDQEVALLLQEQDVKRRGDVMSLEQRDAVEAQDRELAKVLQEQEKARLRRAKQRAREKRRQKQQQQQQQSASPDLSAGDEWSGSVLCASVQAGDDSGASGGDGRLASIAQHSPPRLTSSPIERADHQHCTTSAQTHQSRPRGMSNIATMIDPTYQRRQLHERQHSAVVSPPHATTAADTTAPVLPARNSVRPAMIDGDGGGVSRVRTSPHLEFGAVNDHFVPPYMPIQGQRRSTATDISRAKHSRDSAGCKQQ